MVWHSASTWYTHTWCTKKFLKMHVYCRQWILYVHVVSLHPVLISDFKKMCMIEKFNCSGWIHQNNYYSTSFIRWLKKTLGFIYLTVKKNDWFYLELWWRALVGDVRFILILTCVRFANSDVTFVWMGMETVLKFLQIKINNWCFRSWF